MTKGFKPVTELRSVCRAGSLSILHACKDLMELIGLFNDLTTETSTTLFLMYEFERFLKEQKNQKKREG